MKLADLIEDELIAKLKLKADLDVIEDAGITIGRDDVCNIVALIVTTVRHSASGEQGGLDLKRREGDVRPGAPRA